MAEEKQDRLISLRKKVEEAKGKKKLVMGEKSESAEEKSTVDLAKVENIVKRMKKKYKEKGLELEEVGGKLDALRSAITEGRQAGIRIQTVENLKEYKSPAIAFIGKFYGAFTKIFTPLNAIVSKLPAVKTLDYYLYSANMRYSPSQFLAITTVVAFIIALISFFVTLLVSITFLKLPPTISFLLVFIVPLWIFVLGALLILNIPQRKAKGRADKLNTELPFALRHMGTELRAGIGLYKTLQTIATADYGPLSEEFARTINEIEEGTDMRDALHHFALRTQSKAMKSTLMHIIRALKTGGNLSDIMNTIAEDVSFDLRMKMRDFAEKMNFFGVIFIFVAIVMPVLVSILAAIANAPIGIEGQNMFSAIPLSVSSTNLFGSTLVWFYVFIMPAILFFLTFYLYTTQPKV